MGGFRLGGVGGCGEFGDVWGVERGEGRGPVRLSGCIKAFGGGGGGGKKGGRRGRGFTNCRYPVCTYGPKEWLVACHRSSPFLFSLSFFPNPIL